VVAVAVAVAADTAAADTAVANVANIAAAVVSAAAQAVQVAAEEAVAGKELSQHLPIHPADPSPAVQVQTGSLENPVVWVKDTAKS
jgi:hypothetical protein